jgi:hypothetical protein
MEINHMHEREWNLLKSFRKRVKSIAHKSLTIFLCLWQVVYTMPVGAMEALIDESVTLLSSQSIKSIQPDLSIASVSCNKEGAYALAFHPDLWTSLSQRIVLVDGDIPVGQMSMENGTLNFLAEDASFVLDSKASPQNSYGALAVTTNGLLTIKGGQFTKETSFEALKLRLEDEVTSQLPIRAWGHESLYLQGVLKGYSVIALKSNDLKNGAKVFGDSLHLDIQRGVNEKNGDLGAEKDVVIGQSGESGNTEGFASFLNEGSLRAKRSVSLKGDQFDGTATSKIFAGVLHSFNGDQYLNNGKLFTPNVSFVQSRQAKLGTSFKFDGSYFFASTEERLDIQGSRAKSAEIYATSQVYLQSHGTLQHQGTTFLRNDSGTELPYDQYFDVTISTNTPMSKATETIQRQNLLSQEIEDYRKTINLSQFHKGVGVYLGASYLKQSGTIRSFTGEMEMKGENVLLSGDHYLTNHFKENTLVIRSINATVDGIFEGAFCSSFNSKEHLSLEPKHLKTNCLVAKSGDMTLGGTVDVKAIYAEALSKLHQEKNSHLNAQTALLMAGESEVLEGNNEIQKSLNLHAPNLRHAAQTSTQEMNMHGDNIIDEGKTSAERYKAIGAQSFTQTTSANTQASEQALVEGGDVQLQGNTRTSLLNAHAKKSLETKGNIEASMAAVLHSDDYANIGGHVHTTVMDAGAKNLILTGQTETQLMRAAGEDSLKVKGEHQTSQAELSSKQMELAGKYTADLINAKASEQFTHTGYAQAQTMSVQSPDAKFNGVIGNTENLAIQAQNVLTNWVADIQNLSVTADNAKISGDSRIQQASFLVQELLQFAGSGRIENLSVQAKNLLAEGSLSGSEAQLKVDEKATFIGNVDYEDTLKVNAKDLILHAAHLKSSLLALKAASMTATNSALTSDVALVDVSGGKADLKGLKVKAAELFSLTADQATVNPELITAALAKFYLQTYEDGINGILKLAHQLVHCDKVCFDARKETLVVDQPTKWRKNIALALAKVVLKDSVTSDGTIELISETGIDVLKSIIAESIYLQAKTEDIVIDYALLKAIEEIGIKADEGSVKAQATVIEAQKGDIDVQACLDIELESKSHREGDSENYKDVKDKMQANAGGALKLNAGRDIKLISVETSSEKGTNLKAGRNIIDAPLAEKTQTLEWDKHGFKINKTIFQDVSDHSTKGKFESIAEGTQELFAPEIEAKQISLSGTEGVTVHEVPDVKEHESKSKKKGGWGKKKIKEEQSLKATSKGAKLVGKEPTKISSEKGDISLTNITSKAPKLILDAVEGMVEILLGTNHASSSEMKSKSNIAWQSQNINNQQHRTYTPSTFSGNIEIYSKETIVESVKGQTLELLDFIQQQGGEITNKTLEEFHDVKKQSAQGPTAALAAVVVLAISICTAGAGSALGGMVATAGGLTTTSAAGAITLTTAGSIVSSMTAAGFCSLCSQAGLSLLSNKGDLAKAAKSLANTKTLKSLGISMLSAVVTAGLGGTLDIPDGSAANLSVMDQIQKHAFQMGVNTSMSIIQGEKPEDAIIQGLKGAVAGVVGAVCAGELGQTFKTEDGTRTILDQIMHKALHGVVGAGIGAIKSKDALKGMLAGAIGAVTAEIVAESSSESLSPNMRADLGRLGAALAAFVSRQDIDIAVFAGTNAVENNFKSSFLGSDEDELDFEDLDDEDPFSLQNLKKASEYQGDDVRSDKGIFENLKDAADEGLAKVKKYHISENEQRMNKARETMENGNWFQKGWAFGDYENALWGKIDAESMPDNTEDLAAQVVLGQAGKGLKVLGKAAAAKWFKSNAVFPKSHGKTQPFQFPKKDVAKSSNSLRWDSWANYTKTSIKGRVYAKVGDRLYTRHAVDRMQPGGLGKAAGSNKPGKSVSPNLVEEVIKTGTKRSVFTDKGVMRTIFSSGSVEIVTEMRESIIITIRPPSKIK